MIVRNQETIVTHMRAIAVIVSGRRDSDGGNEGAGNRVCRCGIRIWLDRELSYNAHFRRL